MDRRNIKFIYLTLILLLVGCANTAEPEEEIIPSTLPQAVSNLLKTLSKKDLETIKNGSEDDLYKYHHGFGTGLRNSWGLWSNSSLAQWFNKQGIQHPDDMSGIIIKCLYRELNGLPWELNEQITYYQSYWEEVKKRQEAEAQKDIERKEKRKTAMLNWSWTTTSAPEAVLPEQPDFDDVWGLEPYDNGFIVTLKGWRKEYNPVWHDGVYFIDSKSRKLNPITLANCPVIHDVVVQNNTANWLCRGDKGWKLISTTPSHHTNSYTINIPENSEWLRLGKSKEGLLLISPDSIFEIKSGKSSLLYKSNSKNRQYPQFDSDRPRNEEEFFFAQRSAAPIKFGDTIYFQVEDSGNETDLYRLSLSGNDLEGADKVFVYDYIGRWSVHVSSIETSNYDNLWIGTPRKGTLVKLSLSGEVKFASLFNNLTPLENISTNYETPWRERLPTGAISFFNGKMYLASTNGIVSVENGKITPIVYFVYPDGINRTPYVNRPQYDYHVKPQRLGVFNDGSFLIGDRFDGVYLLLKSEGAFKFIIPEISNSGHLIN